MGSTASYTDPRVVCRISMPAPAVTMLALDELQDFSWLLYWGRRPQKGRNSKNSPLTNMNNKNGLKIPDPPNQQKIQLKGDGTLKI